MKLNISKCIWIACVAVVALCITMTTGYAAGGPPGGNLGVGYISSVTSTGGQCVSSDMAGPNQFWDLQAGGTYTITLSNVIDACSQGNLSSIQVIVHNSTGGNIVATANQLNGDAGEYQFTVTLVGDKGIQCQTMPIEYCTTNGQPGTGLFARDALQGTGNPGHLRTATFDDSCNFIAEDDACQPAATPTPTPCTASITACKYYDFNTNGVKDTTELGLANWPFCLTSGNGSSFSPVQQSSATGGCTTFSNLPPGTYVVTEGTASGTNFSGYFASTYSQTITIDKCDQTVTVNFGNFCTVQSGGLTIGFWSNKNGNKLLTGNTNGTGTILLPGVVTLLNGCSLRNSTGTVHTFSGGSGGYTDFKNWLLGANATNMAYMLSAQLAALKLNVYFAKTDGAAYDQCWTSTVNGLISDACASLALYGNTTSASPQRNDQENMKNCCDQLNNNGPVVPVTPCDYSGASVTCPQ